MRASFTPAQSSFCIVCSLPFLCYLMYGLTLSLERGSTIPPRCRSPHFGISSASPWSHPLRGHATFLFSLLSLCFVFCFRSTFFLRLVGFSGYNFDTGLDWFQHWLPLGRIKCLYENDILLSHAFALPFPSVYALPCVHCYENIICISSTIMINGVSTDSNTFCACSVTTTTIIVGLAIQSSLFNNFIVPLSGRFKNINICVSYQFLILSCRLGFEHC